MDEWIYRPFPLRLLSSIFSCRYLPLISELRVFCLLAIGDGAPFPRNKRSKIQFRRIALIGKSFWGCGTTETVGKISFPRHRRFFSSKKSSEMGTRQNESINSIYGRFRLFSFIIRLVYRLVVSASYSEFKRTMSPTGYARLYRLVAGLIADPGGFTAYIQSTGSFSFSFPSSSSFSSSSRRNRWSGTR